MVFGEAGADASTGEVARRAGVGIGTVFRHFPTKRDLVEATLVRHFELLTRRALDLARAPDPGAALRTLIATLVRTSTTKIVLAEQLVAGGGETAPAVQASRRLRDAVDALLRTAQAGRPGPRRRVGRRDLPARPRPVPGHGDVPDGSGHRGTGGRHRGEWSHTAGRPRLSASAVEDRAVRIAPDGSPVELYLRLPPRTAEAALIHRALPAGATVLDLGCGTGRLAEPLAGLGHRVTAVDNEPAMLAALRRATGVLADVTRLDLGRRFGAVLLMSHFVDAADAGFVDTVLRVVRCHLAGDGVAVVERHPPGWAATCAENDRTVGGVRILLRDLVREGGVLTATVRYELEGEAAEQRFSVVDVDDERLAGLAAAAGMRFDGCLDDARTLAVLRPARVDA